MGTKCILFSLIVTFACAAPTTDNDTNLNIIDIDPFSEIEESNPFTRIVGGRNANPHSAPWIVSLEIVAPTADSYHFCGGAIIKPEWVITAGHCMMGMKGLRNVIVAAGRHNLGVGEATEQIRKLKIVYIHPNYKGGVGPNDLSLLRVEQPFIYTAAVNEVALPMEGTQPEGSATLHGWGSTTTTQNGPLASILQTMSVSLINGDQCKNAMGSFAHFVEDSNICTVGPWNGRPAACTGDSGSALTQNGVIVGTVSWGLTPCATTTSASVFVRVSAFTRWILKTISN